MLSSLTILVETSLELTSSGRDDQTTEVGQSCAHDHIGDIILVTWSIEDRVLLGFGVNNSASHFDSFTLSFFFVGAVHDVSKPPGVTTLVLGLLLELINGTLIDDAHGVDQVTANS